MGKLKAVSLHIIELGGDATGNGCPSWRSPWAIGGVAGEV
jgi:hypothetical protein